MSDLTEQALEVKSQIEGFIKDSILLKKRIGRASSMIKSGDFSITTKELTDGFLTDVAQLIDCCNGQQKEIAELKDKNLTLEAENDRLDGSNMAFDLNDKQQQSDIKELAEALKESADNIDSEFGGGSEGMSIHQALANKHLKGE